MRHALGSTGVAALRQTQGIQRRYDALRKHAASSKEIGEMAEATAFENKAAELKRKYKLRKGAP